MRRTTLVIAAVFLAVLLALPSAGAHEGVAWVVDCAERFIGSGGAYC